MGTSTKSLKSERIDIRLTQEVKDVLTRAAQLAKQPLSTFLIESAYEKASKLISEQEQLILSNEERDKFLTLLDNPPIPNEKAKIAMQKFLSNT